MRYTKQTLDHTTGELVTTENTFTSRHRTQPFISITFPVPAMLHAIANKTTRVLLALAELSEFNTNAVFLVASRRQQVMKVADVSSAQLSACLATLRKHGIIGGGKGEAIIHPTVLWKGDSDTKRGMLAALASSVKSDFDPLAPIPNE